MNIDNFVKNYKKLQVEMQRYSFVQVPVDLKKKKVAEHD
jgi:hypothetical protein